MTLLLMRTVFNWVYLLLNQCDCFYVSTSVCNLRYHYLQYALTQNKNIFVIKKWYVVTLSFGKQSYGCLGHCKDMNRDGLCKVILILFSNMVTKLHIFMIYCTLLSVLVIATNCFYCSVRFIRHKRRVDLPRNPFTRLYFLTLFAASTNQYKTSGNNLSRLCGESRASVKYFRAYPAGMFGLVAGPDRMHGFRLDGDNCFDILLFLYDKSIVTWHLKYYTCFYSDPFSCSFIKLNVCGQFGAWSYAD